MNEGYRGWEVKCYAVRIMKKARIFRFLTASEQRLASELDEYTNRQTGECWRSLDQITKATGLSKHTTIKARKLLCERGYLEVFTAPVLDRYGRAIYHGKEVTHYRWLAAIQEPRKSAVERLCEFRKNGNDTKGAILTPQGCNSDSLRVQIEDEGNKTSNRDGGVQSLHPSGGGTMNLSRSSNQDGAASGLSPTKEGSIPADDEVELMMPTSGRVDPRVLALARRFRPG